MSAYVAGMKEGVILERPFHMGETLKEGLHLDIEQELKIVEQRKGELQMSKAEEDVEKAAMKELGLQRSELASSFQPTNFY